MSLISIRNAGRHVAKADACPLCEGHGTAKIAVPTIGRQRADLLPWAIVLTASVVVAVVGMGAERWFGIGALSGVLAALACAWVSLREARRGADASHAASVRAVMEDADMRVDMVIRQFEWAVNDVAGLKRAVERAEAAADTHITRARERERYVKRLERQLFETRERLVDVAPPAEPLQPEPEAPANTIPFRWGLHMHSDRPILEFALGVTKHRPTRIRILDRDGQVTAVSPPANITADGGIEFTIDMPPADLVADLDAGREPNYAIEALAQYDWKTVHLEDSGSRTRAVTDKQGRWYRVAGDEDSAQLLLN